MLAVPDGLFRSGLGRSTGLHKQVGQALAVHMEFAVHHAHVFVGGLYQHGGCGVAEQRAGGAVLIVGHARHLLGAYHYHLLVQAGLDIGACGLHGDDETGTCGLDVVGVCVHEARVMRYDRSCRRETVVRIGGGAYQQLDVFGLSAGTGQQFLDGFGAHIARAFGFVLKDAALLYAHAGGDPLVVGIHHFRQHLVVEYVLRYIRCYAADLCVCHVSVWVSALCFEVCCRWEEGLFLDDLTAAVISALGAYSVEHVPCATVGTQCDGGDQCLVVGAAFRRTGMRLSAFRMCHCSI